MIDKTFLKNNKKFLIHSIDSTLSDIFIEECKATYEGYTVEYCSDAESFSEVLNRGSLFNDNKNIVVFTDLSDENIQDIEPFVRYNTDDIIVLIERSTLKKNKGYTNLKSNFAYLKLEDLPKDDCRNWLHTYMVQKELNFAPSIPQYIIDKVGTDIGSLSNEVKKLKLLNKEITESLCDSIISSTREANFFVFMENFFHKRFKECLVEFNKVDEEKYISLLHFMLGQVERMYKVAVYREQKKETDEIADLMNLPRFILQTKYYTVLSIFNKVKLLKMLDLLNELDLKIRLLPFDKKMLFEIYISKVFKL
jgi:DNA polymerase III delta subunit